MVAEIKLERAQEAFERRLETSWLARSISTFVAAAGMSGQGLVDKALQLSLLPEERDSLAGSAPQRADNHSWVPPEVSDELPKAEKERAKAERDQQIEKQMQVFSASAAEKNAAGSFERFIGGLNGPGGR